VVWMWGVGVRWRGRCPRGPDRWRTGVGCRLRPGMRVGFRALSGHRRDGRRRRARQQPIAPGTEHHHQRQAQRRGPAHPPPWRPVRSLARGGQQLLQAHRRHRARLPVAHVVFLDQRHRIGPHHLGDGADMSPGVKVAAAGGVIIILDRRDERFVDAGPLADLGHGQAGPAPRRREGFSDAHTRAPLGYGTARSAMISARGKRLCRPPSRRGAGRAFCGWLGPMILKLLAKAQAGVKRHWRTAAPGKRPSARPVAQCSTSARP
jgi:hypothetical protein